MNNVQPVTQSDIEIGWLAKSKAGHDKDQIYVIVDVTADSVFVSDGRLKPVEHPKRKNRRHVQLIKMQTKDMLPDMRKSGFRNEDIKYVLRLYKQQIAADKGIELENGGIICQKPM